MVKKIVLFVLISSVLVVGAFYFTPLPYIPINRLLASSPVISGHVTGSVLSGVRIKNLVIKGFPEGEITAEEIAFRYKGLNYLFFDRLIITEIKWADVKANLSQGNFTNWTDIQRQIEDRLYLIPPVPKKTVSMIQINNFSIHNFDVYFGKSQTPAAPPSALMFPLLMMSSQLLGQGSTPGFSPGGMPPNMPPQPKPVNKFPSFRLHNFEIVNSRFESSESKKSSILNLMKIENLVIEKEKIDMGRLEIQSDQLGLTLAKSPQSGDKWESLIVDIEGVVKRGANENLKKDIGFSGRLADKQINLSACDGKVTLQSGQSPGSILPFMKLQITGINLLDYFMNIAPLSNINTIFQTANPVSTSNLTLITFNIGAGRFEGTVNSRPPMGNKNEPRDLLTAQLAKRRDMGATVVLDSAIPGKLRVKLWQIPPLQSDKYLLSSVFYGKNFAALKPKELAFLKSISQYFGIDPKEFTAASKKPAKTHKARRRR